MDLPLQTSDEIAQIYLKVFRNIARSLCMFIIFPRFIWINSDFYYHANDLNTHGEIVYKMGCIDKDLLSQAERIITNMIHATHNDIADILLYNRKRIAMYINIYTFVCYSIIATILWCILKY